MSNGSFVFPPAWWQQTWLFGSLLVIATLIAYLPKLEGKPRASITLFRAGSALHDTAPMTVPREFNHP
jgi:hypothetical protein